MFFLANTGEYVLLCRTFFKSGEVLACAAHFSNLMSFTFLYLLFSTYYLFKSRILRLSYHLVSDLWINKLIQCN
jgi:hypothetical protein